jgi:hypothetical protein
MNRALIEAHFSDIPGYKLKIGTDFKKTYLCLNDLKI